MQRSLTIVFALAAVISSAIAFVFYFENERLRLALAEQRAARLAEAAAAPEPAEEEADVDVVVTAQQPRQDGQGAAAQPEPPEAFRGGRFERFAEGMSRLLTDPESRAAMLTRMKSRIDRTYGDLFVSLGLDEVQVETLRTLLAERQMTQMEAGMLMRTASTDEEREEARLWREAKLESLNTGVESVLGPYAESVLQDYTRSAPIRNEVEEISRRASYAGAPMSVEQNSRLVSVIQSVGEEIPLPGRRQGDQSAGDRGGRQRGSEPLTEEYVANYLNQLQAQNAAVLDRAREFLTEQQLEALADKQIESFEATQQQLNFSLRNPDMAGMPFIGGTASRRDGFQGRRRGP